MEGATRPTLNFRLNTLPRWASAGWRKREGGTRGVLAPERVESSSERGRERTKEPRGVHQGAGGPKGHAARPDQDGGLHRRRHPGPEGRPEPLCAAREGADPDRAPAEPVVRRAAVRAADAPVRCPAEKARAGVPEPHAHGHV